MSTLYRDFELNDFQETPWYDREIALFKAIIDLLPANGETYVNAEHYHAKLVSPDGTVDPAVAVLDSGFVGVGIATPLGMLHVYSGNSSGTADAGADELIIESAGNAGLSVLVGVAGYAKLFFADDDQTGYINWSNAGFDFCPDGTIIYISARGNSLELNPGTANVTTSIKWDTGVALHVAGASGNTTINYSSTDSDLTVNWDSGVALFVQGSDGVVTINSSALASADFIVKSVGVANVFMVDSDINAVIINQSQDVDALFYVSTNGCQYALLIASGATPAIVLNESGSNIDTRIEGDTDTHLVFIDAGVDKACFSTDTPLAAKVTILQDDASGESCLSLSQADVSEGFIDFVGSDRGAVAWGICSVASLRLELNGTVYRLGLLADG